MKLFSQSTEVIYWESTLQVISSLSCDAMWGMQGCYLSFQAVIYSILLEFQIWLNATNV